MRRRTPAAAAGALLLTASMALAASPPEITVSTSSVALGSVCVNTAAAAKTFTITNDGSPGADPLEVTSITKDGSSAADFSVSPTSGSLDPGESMTVTVGFTPAARGSRTAALHVFSNDTDEPQTDVSLSGTGIDRRLSADRPAVSFGDQRVGTRSPNQTLLLSNKGGNTVTVSSVAKQGVHAADFIVTAPGKTFAIGPGQVKELTIAFQPADAGLRNASIQISSDACGQPTLQVSLVGTGVIPNVLLDPNPIDVGAAPMGSQGPPTAITVSNDGGAPLKITAVQIVGADAADFAASGLPTMPATVQPDESFIFSIRMKPSALGPRVASINVLSDDPDAPIFTVPLRGTGGAPSPSPSASSSPTPTRTASPSPSKGPIAAPGRPNDTLAIWLVVGGVLAAFGGLFGIRRVVARDEED